ncbi:MAG: hypothetical protein DWH80_08685 [Planctomycetota bacterium]|nr:MAG: hypothetical protein DWH80_08685 [Planctomycetota bacterium]
MRCLPNRNTGNIELFFYCVAVNSLSGRTFSDDLFPRCFAAMLSCRPQKVNEVSFLFEVPADGSVQPLGVPQEKWGETEYQRSEFV